MKNLTEISVAASVVSVANVAKVGVASALIGAGLFLSACGGDSPKIDDKHSALLKEKYPNAQILSFTEAEKELDTLGNKPKNITIKECFDKHYPNSYFIKLPNGEMKVIHISDSSEIDESPVGQFSFKSKFHFCFLY